ncbi:MAG: 6-pyruvoyl tetrahydrobiopterin synthase [Herpetosiphonaceae bacterium]|nr:MAG: 6-pyruvoyl tetrahydrobiopterin synthase [Herpetosiphonaceae bacterium]
MSYRLEVIKDELGFASAHFITYHQRCERLHGHNYQAAVEIEGELGPDGFVFDFIALKRIMRELCQELDHRVLLAAQNKHLTFTEQEGHLTVTYEDKRYVFPLDAVVMLPIANTTAELLATYLCKRLKARLREAGAAYIKRVAVSVSEGPGQRGIYSEPFE